ncbi:MAG: LysM peptidoglycan-binding domain-containing protein [Gammaproteobacteria bacterium]|nr:LysM peptidoglycan-binding domain-containing protein [Gammaproteobacteria bacterium]MYD76383.1 LysM peptidoglycan-binding domain-containing protein [Gammaproteobacteria bacterium]MYJ52960.1 LysM peptidoglycan-binding domain-containing protein [Gammaproteobacteria bacterium]
MVAEGDNLWNIAAHEEVYFLPEQWPLIYKENLEQITDADLIYPGQVLDIPRGMAQDEIDAAVHHARNRGAWSLGPVEASDKEYLKSSN